MRIVRFDDKHDHGKELLSDSYFSIPPRHPDAYKRALSQIHSRDYPRKWLSEQLVKYNSDIGNDLLAIDNARRISDKDSYCVVTGQQLGYFGGPAYSILKGICCLLHARRYGAIPVYWLATEDHDVAEIDHAETINHLGNLRRHRISLSRDGRAVEDLVLTPDNVKEIRLFSKEFGIDISNLNVEAGRPYASVMASFLAQLFQGTGLLFIEPRLLREKAAGFFRREIENAEEFNAILRKTTENLLSSGGRAPIRFVKGETNLFYKDSKCVRKKIHAASNGFKVGSQFFDKEDLIGLIEGHFENFSTAAAARPLLQAAVIPTLAYVAGPAEMDYHRQLKDYFHAHSIPMPWMVPRFSMSFIPFDCGRYLDFIGLQPWQQIPKYWEDCLSGTILFEGSMSNKSAIKEFLAGHGIPFNALHILANVLKPHGALQERSLNWCWAQSQIKDNLIEQILKRLEPDISGHHYCYLGKNDE